MKWLQTVFLAMTVTSMIGCSSSYRVKRELNLTAQEVIAEVNSRAAALTTLKGDGRITVESREGSNNVSFDVYLKKPDSVRVEFRGPFGLQIGALSLTKEKFIFYDRSENTAVISTPDGKTLRSFLNLNIRFEEIFGIFTGEFFVNGKTDSLPNFSTRNGRYTLQFNKENEIREYEIDRDDLFVSGYRLLDGDGNVQMYTMAQRPIETNSIVMPSWLRVVFPQERRSITIVYDDIELNTPVRCAISLPNNVEVIYR